MKKIVVSLLLSATVLSGCQSMSKQDAQVLGGIGGAVAGGLLGSRFGGGVGKLVMVGVGTALGTWAGSELAGYLTEPDKQAASNALSTAALTGETSEWSNPDTNVRGRAQVRQTVTTTRAMDVAVLKDRVEAVPPMEMIGEPYAAKAKATVYGGPGTDYKSVGALKSGEVVEVVGKVKGKPYYLVSKGGVGQGFVAASALRAAPASDAETVAVLREQMAEAELAKKQGRVQSAKVEGEGKCRTIDQEIVLADGTKKTETTKACQGPTGWEVVS